VPQVLIPLPTEADRLVIASNPTSLLGPDRPGEVANKVPGPVDDVEDVNVSIANDGSPTAVAVDQRLTLHGTGDFSFKEPGPALDAVAPILATTRPGLRRGAVIWEGFSPGRKSLLATVTLDPANERPKLPLRIEIMQSPVAEIRLVNQTGLPVNVADGEPDPVALKDSAARAQTLLAAGRTPLGGADGLPSALPARSNSRVEKVSRSEPAPLRVHGIVTLPVGPPVTIDAVLPSGAHPDGVLRVPGAGPLVLDLAVTVVAPDATRLADATATPRDRLAALQDVMWQGLRAGAFAAYLGNPKPGSSVSTFHYVAAAPTPAIQSAARSPKARPGAIALAAVAALCIVLAGAAIWSRS
jgi:hypothetical protein